MEMEGERGGGKNAPFLAVSRTFSGENWIDNFPIVPWKDHGKKCNLQFRCRKIVSWYVDGIKCTHTRRKYLNNSCGISYKTNYVK